jgi:hypothetical protein
MPKHDVHTELAPRLEAYGLDEDARARLQELWPILEPHLRDVIDAFVVVASKIPQIAATFAKHHVRIHELELAHHRHLLSGRFDDAYMEFSQYSAREHSSIGVEARVRLNSGCMVMRRMTDVIARRYWYSPAKVGAYTKLISQAILCDAALTSTLHLQIVANSRASRRKRIEEAIAEFGDTIGAVIGAVKEATGSLATTSAGLQQAASETLGRTASASTALGATANPSGLRCPRPRSCRIRSRRSATRPTAAWRWRAPPSARPSGPAKPSARSTKPPSTSAPWSRSSPRSHRRPISWR